MMKAMVLTEIDKPLDLQDKPVPQPGAGEVLLQVKACAVCRTDLHLVHGELPEPELPIIPGHEIVGIVKQAGDGSDRFSPGERVGVPWLGYTCGVCRYCKEGRENLCDNAKFTGYQLNGGYAEYCVADQRYCFTLPEKYSDIQAAPLLCAGLIGYRAYSMVKDSESIGLYGFGASAHILAQVALYEGKKIFAFTRPDDAERQIFARKLGADWVGGSDEHPPENLDAAIIFAPVGALVHQALQAVRKGGTVVCAGIHMSDIPSLPYSDLWGERSIRSVTNLTRADGDDFLALAAEVPIRVSTKEYYFEDANDALSDLRAGRIDGAAVLVYEEKGGSDDKGQDVHERTAGVSHDDRT